ncbi:alcohol dehydrogenase catalytic domain-containing protein [Streptomyces hydrogenans]|uniref:alcohol dehydrogenase catalytic domain-containing protein n=1 Tax=Streptomyces hydrogenans TaxID=1873719 RepID=UPI00382473CA
MKITGAVLEHTGATGDFRTARPLTVTEVELAAPGPNEVLVRIDAAGVCHSDLSVVNGNRRRPLPMLLGHEASATVLETGRDVTDLPAGSRVVATFMPRCDRCAACATDGRLPCTPGTNANTAGVLFDGGSRLSRAGVGIAHHLGVSAFATHAVVDRRSIVPVGDDVPADVAALLGCAVLTGGGAVLNVRPPRDGDTVAVIGLGGVGMAALMVAVAAADCRVIAVDTLETKLVQARELGAAEALTPQQAVEAGVAADLVVEAAGHPRAFETALGLAAPGATVVTVGLPAPDATARVAPLDITSRALSVVGSYLGSALPNRDIPRYAQQWREGRLPLEKLISSRIRLHQINEAMDRLARGDEIRQIITFGDTL